MILLTVFLCTDYFVCHGQSQRYLCQGGFGNFTAEYPTGVIVSVGASRNGGFATRACDARLRWGDDELSVVKGAARVDIDVMGADLGLGTPVIAFQIKNSATDRVITYEIYSLQKPPRLLHTITGADYYDAKDANFEDRNEIWANDAGVINGFENMPRSSFDFAPTVVLRFEKHRLIDVSSEYQPFYDRQIETVKAQVDPRWLNEFMRSDGKPSSSSHLSMTDLHMLLRTKIQVLEIVWSYLYSGREQQAWSALAEMWPPADVDRIRGLIQDARARGILRQVDDTSKPGMHTPWKHHAAIFDMKIEHKEMMGLAADAISAGSMATNTSASDGFGEKSNTSVDVPPKAIYLGITLRENETQTVPHSRISLDLVIDAAGKVRSAQITNKADRGPTGDLLINASESWNFIPAYRGSRPVACKIQLGVSPAQ